MTPRDTILRGRETLAALRHTMQTIGRRAIALLVEDAPDDIELTVRQFQMFDVALDVVHSAAEAIEKLKEGDYDVLFVDLVLQRDSGLDVISYAASQEPALFCIVLTGINDENPMIKEALDRGAQCVIRKPIIAEHLRMMFRSVP